MKKGFPLHLKIGSDIRKIALQNMRLYQYNLKLNFGNFQDFISNALFSVCPFLAEDLYINKNRFNLLKWREQFDIFLPNTYEGLNFYRNRASIPIEAFKSFENIKRKLFEDFSDCKLHAQFNSQREGAIFILGKHINIYPNYFCYVIEYGEEDDYQKVIKGSWGSSWEIRIMSRVDENYIDFCLRLFHNYDGILSKDSSVIELDRNYNYRLIGS